MTTTRVTDRDSWTVLERLPERDLAEVILDLAAPLLEKLGPAPRSDDARAAIELAVTFWNASVLASKQWQRPRTKALNELERRMRGSDASRDDAAAFDVLAERWRAHWLDPRLVKSWTYEADAAGELRLACKMGLPGGVRLKVAPPMEKRIAIGDAFLDEVQISRGGNALLSFPPERHRGVLEEGGGATIYTMMPSALQLLADGRLPGVGRGPIEVVIGGRSFGPMVLAKVHCSGDWHDVAILVFRPASGAPRSAAEGRTKAPATT